jgi:hypothetical protein
MFILNELGSLLTNIKRYHLLIIKYQSGKLTSEQKMGAIKLKELIQIQGGRHQGLIKELSGHPCKITTLIKDKEIDRDMWLGGLKLPADEDTLYFLDVCIDITVQAIGKLEDDISKGRRDKKTGERIDKAQELSAKPPKAFIAHEGETRALTMLKEFLEALGTPYFIAEAKASSGRSIERQVN